MSRWLIMVGVVVILAGLLFGYDQGVINGALEGIQSEFHLGTGMTEVIISWVTLGALFGALTAGQLADHRGRRFALVFAAVLFTAGAALEALAPISGVLVVGRLVVGFGVGVASVAAPLYAAEHAPDQVAWPLRLVVPAGDHDRHLQRLSRRPGADEQRRLAPDARCVRGAGGAARGGDGGDAGKHRAG